MEVVYYKDESLNYCPVKKYLDQYIKNDADKPEQRSRKDKVLAEMNARIQNVLQNNGIAIPPLSKNLSGYDYFEIKLRKNQNILIRVFYFRHEDKIVLLNALEKPDNYNARGRDDREIEKELKITQDYLNKFRTNPKLYEKYDSEIN